MMGAIPEKIEPDFLFYVLLNIDFSNFVQSGAVPSINQAQISNIETILPCSAEQTQIATILSTIDRAIEQTEALIAKQQRIKTGLMQDLLTKGIDENGNIRSEETHEFKDSPLGRIPVEWDCKDIITIAYVTKLAGFEFTNYFNYSIGGEIIALRALNIKNEKLDLTDIQTIPKKVSDILPRSKINRNDILITYIGAYIGDVLRIEDNEKFHLAPNIAKIVSKDGVYPQFLEIALRTHYLQRQIKNLTATTATPSLTMTQIRSLLVAIPRNQSEQKVITEHISRITKVIDENASRLAKLKLQKTGLMQDLLTGKVRVTDLLNQKTAVN
jgi:type I restriction enzyme S subunit